MAKQIHYNAEEAGVFIVEILFRATNEHHIKPNQLRALGM